MRILILSIALICLTSSAAAGGWQPFEAQTTATVEVREAPGPYDPIAKIPARTNVTVGACFKEGAWCEVTSGDINGYADATLLKSGNQTVKEKYEAYWQVLLAASVYTSPFIWTEGDSYMQGAYGINLFEMIASSTGRVLDSTAQGGSDMDGISQRMLSPSSAKFRSRITVVWDGASNGLITVKDYVDLLEEGIDQLGHDHFVVIPAMAGDDLKAIAKEFKSRWPDNTLDWRDVFGDHPGTQPPDDLLAKPQEDKTHLGKPALQQMAIAIGAYIRSKGW